MRVTRKTLQAENTQFRAQLAVHDNVTRKALNEYVGATKSKNKALEFENTTLKKALEEARNDLLILALRLHGEKKESHAEETLIVLEKMKPYVEAALKKAA